MKKRICIIGSVGLFLMSLNVYGQNYQSVLKQNMELKIEISNLKGELKTKNETIKRVKDQLMDRNAEIRKLKKMLKDAGVLVEEKKYRVIPKSELQEIVSKTLGTTNRKGVKRIWAINYFTIPGTRKSFLCIDWSLNTPNASFFEDPGNRQNIMKSVNRLMKAITINIYNENAKFDYLLLRHSSPVVDKYGNLFETISPPTIIRRSDLARINWRLFKGNILSISEIDSETKKKIVEFVNREPRLKFKRIKLE